MTSLAPTSARMSWAGGLPVLTILSPPAYCLFINGPLPLPFHQVKKDMGRPAYGAGQGLTDDDLATAKLLAANSQIAIIAPAPGTCARAARGIDHIAQGDTKSLAHDSPSFSSSAHMPSSPANSSCSLSKSSTGGASKRPLEY